MKNLLLSILSFIKRKKWLVGAGVLILVVVVLLLGGNGEELKTATVERGTIVAEVSVTGKVKPSRSVDIAFERSGRISSIRVEVGDKVSQGQILITQENGDFMAQLAQAQAQLKSQESKLEQLKRGSRPEDIQIKRLDLQKAQGDLNNYYANAVNIINDAYSKSNDAINKQLDGIFYGANSDAPTLSFTPDNYQLKGSIETQRLVITKEINNWTSEINNFSVSSSGDTIFQALDNVQNHVLVIRNFLNSLLNILNGTGSVPSATLTTYKTNTNTGLTNINLAANSASVQQQTITSQKLLVQKTQDELNLKIAGSDPQDITYQEGQVENARANVAYTQSQLGKTIITAPFSGTVTKIVPEVGNIVQPNSVVVSVIGSGMYQIEANITESDINKVKVGNKTSVTLDAYGPGVVFEANVISIDLSETMIEGIPTYKTILQFVAEDKRILPGLTADADILTDRKENVLFVPTRNITTRNGEKYVKLLIDEKKQETKEVKIETGLRGSDGRTEIISGLKEGDKIVIE